MFDQIYEEAQEDPELVEKLDTQDFPANKITEPATQEEVAAPNTQLPES